MQDESYAVIMDNSSSFGHIGNEQRKAFHVPFYTDWKVSFPKL